MKRTLTGAFLGLLLCLAASVTVFAAEARTVTVTAYDLKPGYYMGAVWDGDTLLTLFDAQVGSSGTLNKVVDIGDTPTKGNAVTVAVSDANVNSASSKPIVLTNVPIKTGGSTPSEPDTPSTPDYDDSSYRYSIDLSSSSNGYLSASASRAAPGSTVTVYIHPNSGYEWSRLHITGSNGRTVSYSSRGDVCTFTMPYFDVTVWADFSYVTTYTPPDTSDTVSIPSRTGSLLKVLPSFKYVPRPAFTGQIFTDVPSGQWGAAEINWVCTHGLMEGVGNGLFNPNGTVSRQQMWMVLSHLSGSNPANMAEAKAWAVRGKISDGSKPGQAVTRQQLAALLFRYAKSLGYRMTKGDPLTEYDDHNSVAGYAKEAVAWCIGFEIIDAVDWKLYPNTPVSRAQLAISLERLQNNYVGRMASDKQC